MPPGPRVIPSLPKLWNGLANSPEYNFKKKMKEGRKKRERKRQRREQKERRRGQRERKEEGRQASEKDGHRLGF